MRVRRVSDEGRGPVIGRAGHARAETRGNPRRVGRHADAARREPLVREMRGCFADAQCRVDSDLPALGVRGLAGAKRTVSGHLRSPPVVRDGSCPNP